MFGYAQTDWELKKNEDGIQVYTRELGKSSIKEFKVVSVFQTNMSSIIDKITDAENLKNWNYRTTKSKLLERVSDSVFVVYMYNDFPWPIKDRDHVSKLVLLKESDSTVKINITSLFQKVPKDNNTIRIEEFSGFWLIEKIDDGVRVTQQMHGEPKGNVPSVIINATLTKAPFNTLKNLKTVLSN